MYYSDLSRAKVLADGLRSLLQKEQALVAYWKTWSQTILRASSYAIKPEMTVLDQITGQLSELLRVYSNLVLKEINDQELTPEKVVKVAEMNAECAHCSQFVDSDC